MEGITVDLYRWENCLNRGKNGRLCEHGRTSGSAGNYYVYACLVLCTRVINYPSISFRGGNIKPMELGSQKSNTVFLSRLYYILYIYILNINLYIYDILYIILYIYITYYILHITYYILHITYYILHITYYILHITYYILYYIL